MLSWNGYTSVSSWTVKVWWWNRMELRRCFSTLIHWNKKRSPERSEIFWPGSARKRTVKSVVCVSIRPPLAESRKLQTVRRISDTSCLQPVQQQIPPTDWLEVATWIVHCFNNNNHFDAAVFVASDCFTFLPLSLSSLSRFLCLRCAN